MVCRTNLLICNDKLLSIDSIILNQKNDRCTKSEIEISRQQRSQTSDIRRKVALIPFRKGKVCLIASRVRTYLFSIDFIVKILASVSERLFRYYCQFLPSWNLVNIRIFQNVYHKRNSQEVRFNLIHTAVFIKLHVPNHIRLDQKQLKTLRKLLTIWVLNIYQLNMSRNFVNN